MISNSSCGIFQVSRSPREPEWVWKHMFFLPSIHSFRRGVHLKEGVNKVKYVLDLRVFKRLGLAIPD